MKYRLVVTLAGLFVAGTVMAAPMNSRPVNPAGDLSSLQGVLDGTYVSGPGIDAVADQKPFSLFTSTASGGSVATFVIELAAFADTNEFGIYSADDSTNKALVFGGAEDPADQATITFLADGTVIIQRLQINETTGALEGVSMDMYSGFNPDFGFYLDVNDPSVTPYTVYSEDWRNGDVNGDGADDPHLLVYEGDDTTVLQLPQRTPGTFTSDEFVLAFEDLLSDVADNDFTDMVVMVESIEPVPEPGTLLLLGLSCAGLGLVSRRRRGRKSA